MQPLQLLLYVENAFDTPSKSELRMSSKYPLGVEKVTTLVPFILESDPWVFHNQGALESFPGRAIFRK